MQQDRHIDVSLPSREELRHGLTFDVAEPNCGPIHYTHSSSESFFVVAGSSVISRLKGAEFRIDRICRRFEQAWRQDRPVSIEHCLLEVEPVEQPRLLEELIAAEWELRIRHDEIPVAGDYLHRFPDHQDLVETICGVMTAEFAEAPVPFVKSLPQEGDHLGDYRIIREIGRGGMGIVFEARQESLGRQVALKVLPARRFQNERELLRFRREAQSVARLHHSHIVEIYGVGEQDGVHYFAMRYVVGRSLDEVICELRQRLGMSDAPLSVSVLDEPASARTTTSSIHTGSSLFLSRVLSSPQDSIDSQNSTARYRAVARIGHQVAEALQYAHERGILHRDVKPSNLLLDRQEVCWLSDFGLAKVNLEAADITESDDLIGTMKYMSPEALSGTMDERSDLYSLGLTLYELATLRPVLDAVDRGQLLEQVKEPHPAAPRRFAPEIPRDLETVILKAIAVDPNQRYRSAADLADDLERFLNHEPIKARPQSTWTKLRRWVERKPLLAFLALGTISITATSLFSFVSLYYNARQTALSARQERDRADQLRTEAEDARAATEASRRTAELLTIEAEQRLIQVQRSKAATRLQGGDDFGALVWTAETLRLLEKMKPSQLDVKDEVSPAQTATARQAPAAVDGISGDWFDRTGHLALEPALRLRVGAMAEYAPRILHRIWLPKVLQTWSSLSTERLDARWHAWDEDRILFDKSGQFLNLANAGQTQQIQWDLATGQLQSQMTPGPDNTYVYTRSGEARIIWESNRSLKLQSTDPGEVPRTLQVPPGKAIIRPVAGWQSPDRKYLLASFQVASANDAEQSEVQSWLWNVATGHVANDSPLPVDGHLAQIEFSRDCQRMFVRSDQAVQVLELPGWNPLFSTEQIDPQTAAWSHDGQWLATKSGNYTALFNVSSATPRRPQLIESPGLRGIRFEEGGGGMALLLQRGHIAFLSIGSGQDAQFRDFSHPQEIDVRSFHYSPDGQWYALACNDGNIRVWSVHYNQPITGFLRHSSVVTSVAWSPRGDLLGTLTQDGLMTVWDVRACCAAGQILSHPASGRLKTVRFSPDGLRVAAGGTQATPVIWNLAGGRVQCLPRPAGAAFVDSKADRRTASVTGTGTDGGSSSSAQSHERARQQRKGLAVDLRRSPHAIAGFPNPEIQGLDWSRDGQWLAAVCGNSRNSDDSPNENLLLRVWETEQGLNIPFQPWPYRAHLNAVSMPRFVSDGRLMTHSSSHADLLTWPEGPATVRFKTDKKSWVSLTRISPDDRFLALAYSTGKVGLFRLEDGALLYTLALPEKQRIHDLAFNHQGTQLAAVGQFGLRVWNAVSGESLRQPDSGTAIQLYRVAFSTDDRHLATITDNHVCHFHDTFNWERHATTFQLESRPVLAEFNSDQTFLTVTETGLMQIWDWSRGELLTPPLRNVQAVHDADLSRDGTRVAVISDHAVRIWKLPRPDLRPVSEIAAWARDVTLTEVDIEESTLVPTSPGQYPEQGDGMARAAVSPLTVASKTIWHLRQTHEAFLNRDAVAVEFHIQRLRELVPHREELGELQRRLDLLRSETLTENVR